MRLGHLVLFPLAAGLVASAFGDEDSKPVALAQTPQAVQNAIAARVGDGTLEEIDQTTGINGGSYDVDYLSKSGTEGGFTVSDTGALQSVEITFADMPAAVQKTILTDAAGCQLSSIDKNTDGTYDVDVLRAGTEHDFTVADDGTILSGSVAIGDTPAPVQATIAAQSGGWQVDDINKNVDEFPATYDVDYVKDGQEKGVTIGSDGTLVSMEVPLANLTPAAQAAVTRIVGAGKVTSIEQNMDPDGMTYDVEAQAANGANLSFTVGPGGAEQSEQVSINQVPPAPRATITQTIGDGEILRVDRILIGKEDKVLPYSVEGRKDGKSFDFSVGPKGRFLGMDP
jgi:uncharacterized membrane protein YkoI